MRTISVMTERLIAVITKHTKSFWEVIFAEPIHKIYISPKFFSVFPTTPANMVNGQKLYMRFFTASTNPTILFKHLQSRLSSPLRLSIPMPIFIVKYPSFGTKNYFSILFWRSSSSAVSVLNFSIRKICSILNRVGLNIISIFLSFDSFTVNWVWA